MADPALTVADLEAPKSTDRLEFSEAHTESTKDNGTTSYLHSILKKSKMTDTKKVVFTDPDKNMIHEISMTKPGTTECSEDSKNSLSEGLPTIESQNTESLRTLSMLNSEGLLKSLGSQVQSASDLRWKSNTISSKHSAKKHYGQSACEIFRQRLNGHYIKSIERNFTSADINLKKPDIPIHLVYTSDHVMLVRNYKAN
ncbi:hypothetical protein SteCoe_19998 [Stentor coeruleus]|uniref:Uncharacterized protein n=1 Tax=Stentor coeruleus TaxID=5963 RepID=A0A1R2BSS9_9CILI|nr:hypothetical protein SteCoe_19998 [Stentor coeruleus]